MKTVVFNPVSRPSQQSDRFGARLATLESATVGFLSNNKPNAEVLLERVGERLSERCCVDVRHYSKEVPSLQAPPELIERIAEDCQAVVLAVDD